jgi:5-formyltetrahydrofolate cyclo-ligase
VFMPGVGFDRRGGRLGHGRGYYDRAVAQYDRRCIGLAFACQVVDQVPVERHDRLVEVLITEEGAITTAAGERRSGAVFP